MSRNLTSDPPICLETEFFRVHHGERFPDEYSWLEDRTNRAVLKHLHAETEYADYHLQRQTEAMAAVLYREFSVSQTSLGATNSVPQVRAKYEYFSRSIPGKQYPVQCRRTRDESKCEEIILDINAFESQSNYVNIRGYVINPNETKVAYCVDLIGSRRYRLFVKDLNTGLTTDTGVVGVGGIEWMNRSDALVVVLEEENTKRRHKVVRYYVDEGRLERLYEETDPLFAVVACTTRDGAYLLVTSESTTTSEVWFIPNTDSTLAPRVILPRVEGHRYHVEHHEGWFFIRSNKDRPGFDLFRCKVDRCHQNEWEVVFQGQEETSVESYEMFEDFVLVFLNTRLIRQLVALSLRDGSKWNVAEVEIGAIFSGQNRTYSASKYLYKVQSFLTPPTLLEADLRNLTTRVVVRQDLASGLDPDRYEVNRIWVRARDGAEVPVSLLRTKDQRCDSPFLLLNVYGAYGAPNHILFDRSRFSLVDRGVTVAIAHVRGGGDLGPDWHKAGRGRRKGNTVNDLFDIVEYLVDRGWTASGKILLYGASAGGVIVGAALNRCPGLFAAAYMNAPFVDVLNTMCDKTLPLTAREYLEWGNPQDLEDYRVIRALSPYENIAPQVYPPVLITASLNDSQVMYWEAAKYAARLRRHQMGDNPILLFMRMDSADHGGRSGKYDLLRERALIYAWLLRQCDIITERSQQIAATSC